MTQPASERPGSRLPGKNAVRPSVPDPPEAEAAIWHNFGGGTGWDVGGNCGQTVLTMKFSFDTVISFEPSPASYEYAVEYVRRFGVTATILNIALSDHDGELELAYPGSEQEETGQLVTIGTKGMEWEPKDWGTCTTLTVSCRAADSLAAELGQPDFLKVDTEGHEVKVLQGAKHILALGQADFLVEFHTPQNHADCQFLLDSAGYRTEVVRHPHYRPQSAMWYQHGWIRAFAPRKVL